jgi:hypothetical protein
MVGMNLRKLLMKLLVLFRPNREIDIENINDANTEKTNSYKNKPHDKIILQIYLQ